MPASNNGVIIRQMASGPKTNQHPESISRQRNQPLGGTLGFGALALPELLRSRAEAAVAGRSVKDTSVIWLWLGGGPTHVETFDPKMTAPSEFRSVTGEVSTTLPGVTLGGTFPEMAKIADKFSLGVFELTEDRGSSNHYSGHWRYQKENYFGCSYLIINHAQVVATVGHLAV